MSKKSMVLTLTLLLLPSVVLAWTVRAQMNGTYPNIGGGYTCFNQEGYGIIETDYTSNDPPNVLRTHINEGIVGGNSPVSCFIKFAPLREIYFQYWFKYSTNHYFHPDLDKQFYFYSDNMIPPCDNFGQCGRMPRMFPSIGGGEGNPHYVLHFGGATSQVSNYNPAKGPIENGYRREPNMNISAGTIRKGIWYKVNGHIQFGTPENRDGISEIWINDVQIMKYPNPATGHTGNNYLRSSDTGISESSITPVWGGGGQVTAPAGGMDLWFDDFIVSTEPIAGMIPILPDPQQKIPNPPANIQLN